MSNLSVRRYAELHCYFNRYCAITSAMTQELSYAASLPGPDVGEGPSALPGSTSP